MSSLCEDRRPAVQCLESIRPEGDEFWTNLEWLTVCLGRKVEDVDTTDSPFSTAI